MWSVYADGAGNYTVAKQPVGLYAIYIFGPAPWGACAAKLAELGVPGWPG